MKLKITQSYSLAVVSALLLIALSQLTSCGSSDPGLTGINLVKARLINTWKVQSVTVDGVDKTSLYPGLTIQFTATAFSSTNGKPVWPASGSWSFDSTDGTTFLRNDGIQVRVEVTDTILKLTLDWPTTTLGGGRVNSVKGVNVFTFTR